MGKWPLVGAIKSASVTSTEGTNRLLMASAVVVGMMTHLARFVTVLRLGEAHRFATSM